MSKCSDYVYYFIVSDRHRMVFFSSRVQDNRGSNDHSMHTLIFGYESQKSKQIVKKEKEKESRLK